MDRYIRRITISEGKVTTQLLDMNTFEYNDKTLQMSDILQSLTGNCQIPRGCISGLVLCDHSTNSLSTINTCAPSINLSTKNLKSYDDFKTMMVSMLCDDEGFGLK